MRERYPAGKTTAMELLIHLRNSTKYSVEEARQSLSFSKEAKLHPALFENPQKPHKNIEQWGREGNH